MFPSYAGDRDPNEGMKELYLVYCLLLSIFIKRRFFGALGIYHKVHREDKGQRIVVEKNAYFLSVTLCSIENNSSSFVFSPRDFVFITFSCNIIDLSQLLGIS